MKKKENIAVISLINNTPLNSGGKMASFYFNKELSKNYLVDFYFFENEEKIKKESIRSEKQGNIGYNPNSKEIPFNKIKIKSSLPKFIPKIIRKFHFEILLGKKLNNIKCDKIVLEFPYLYHIAKKISKNNNNCPIYLLEHNIEWKYYKGNGSKIWPLVKILEKKVLSKVDGVFTFSERDFNNGFSFVGKKIKIKYIKMGVLEDKFFHNLIDSKENKKLKYRPGKKSVLFYGKMDIKQNKDAMKYIYNNLLEGDNRLRKIYFNIFGINGNKNDYFYQHDQIYYHGTINNPSEYINEADFLIFPVFNGAGLKMRILESLYCGKIILISHNIYNSLDGKLKKLLDRGVFVFNNDEQYKNKIEYLLNLSKENKNNFEENIKKTISIYKSSKEGIDFDF